MLDCQPGGLEFNARSLLPISTAAESVFSEVVDGADQSNDVCLAVKVSKSQQTFYFKKIHIIDCLNLNEENLH